MVHRFLRTDCPAFKSAICQFASWAKYGQVHDQGTNLNFVDAEAKCDHHGPIGCEMVFQSINVKVCRVFGDETGVVAALCVNAVDGVRHTDSRAQFLCSAASVIQILWDKKHILRVPHF
jgi:hypothetical protein